jgi:inositol hexakisphosphate/diphosphoinositol-pentakisphosphate kinase
MLKKPFIEKPMDAEDHNIWIYYPLKDDGGCKKLFRKVDDKSSDYDKNINSIRKTGNFIYEEFLTTNGFDIKVYCVGSEYAHAEVKEREIL